MISLRARPDRLLAVAGIERTATLASDVRALAEAVGLDFTSLPATLTALEGEILGAPFEEATESGTALADDWWLYALVAAAVFYWHVPPSFALWPVLTKTWGYAVGLSHCFCVARACSAWCCACLCSSMSMPTPATSSTRVVVMRMGWLRFTILDAYFLKLSSQTLTARQCC